MAPDDRRNEGSDDFPRGGPIVQGTIRSHAVASETCLLPARAGRNGKRAEARGTKRRGALQLIAGREAPEIEEISGLAWRAPPTASTDVERTVHMGMLPMLQTLVVVAAVALSGCAATLKYAPVPAADIGRAEVAGYSNIRTWGNAAPREFNAAIGLKDVAPVGSAHAQIQKQESRLQNYLALSGGGGDGAYGAGLLVGWTLSGERPAFDIVTGVSTGALAAPFAFLGPRYDSKLEEIYTRFKTGDLGGPRLFSAALGGPSLIDSSGLEKLLAHYVSGELKAELAREHARGRRLLVATTNVEAERQVIWNLGAIAASANADSLDLIRRILLASAAIPGVLPPVLIKVTVDGREFQEMHADGGTIEQVFFVPRNTTAASKRSASAPARLYVIRNGKIGSEWQSIEPTSFKIASRALGTLIKNQARGDIERLYARARADGIAFRLAAIPESFSARSTEPFDKTYMRRLFDLGYAEAGRGYTWAKAPPWFGSRGSALGTSR